MQPDNGASGGMSGLYSRLQVGLCVAWICSMGKCFRPPLRINPGSTQARVGAVELKCVSEET